jgi:hypothetical protein
MLRSRFDRAVEVHARAASLNTVVLQGNAVDHRSIDYGRVESLTGCDGRIREHSQVVRNALFRGSSTRLWAVEAFAMARASIVYRVSLSEGPVVTQNQCAASYSDTTKAVCMYPLVESVRKATAATEHRSISAYSGYRGCCLPIPIVGQRLAVQTAVLA